MRVMAALLVPLALAAQTADKQAALGLRLAAEVERQFDVLDDPAVGAYLSGLGTRMAAVAGYQQPLTIRILKEEKPRNAVFPGGHVYLTSGMIGALGGEAELAGLLAHDLAHLKDPRTEAASNSSIRLVWGCLWWGAVPKAVRSAAETAEEAADRDAVHFLAAAGYDPRALPDLYTSLRVRSAEARTVADYVRNNFPPAEAALVSTGEFSAMQMRVAPPRRPPSLLHPN